MLHWWKVQASGLGLALLSGFLPTLAFGIPYDVKIAGVAAGTVLLVWPLWITLFSAIKNRNLARKVGLGEAAQLFYEAMERSGIDDRTSHGYPEGPLGSIDHFRYVLLSAAKRGSIVLTAARFPSRQSRPIPRDEIGQLWPDQSDPNGLRSLSPSSQLDFRNVRVSKRDLRMAIKDRIGSINRDERRA